MIQQTPGKIFLADERGVAESDRFRRFSTFNFGPFAHAHKGPFGRLYGLNEETLAGGHALDFTVAEASYVLLLPITGAVALRYGTAPETTVEAEEAVVLALPPGSVLQLQNPFADELVSLLHCWLLADAPVPASAMWRATFHFAERSNRLTHLAFGVAAPLPFAASLGRFDGRQECVYRPQQPGNSLFAFVLAGAFEAEGRLLHEKDGLALWNVAAIELEALSNGAIVLVLELTGAPTALPGAPTAG